MPNSKWHDFLFTESSYNICKVVCCAHFFFYSLTPVFQIFVKVMRAHKRVMKSKWICSGRWIYVCTTPHSHNQLHATFPQSNMQQIVSTRSSSRNKATTFSHSLAPFVAFLVVCVCVCGGGVDIVKLLSFTKARPLMIQEEKTAQKIAVKKKRRKKFSGRER